MFAVDQLHAFDLETHLFSPGRRAPSIVCGSEAGPEGAVLLENLAEVLARAQALLEEGAVFVGANLAYDMACLLQADDCLAPAVFAAYRYEDGGRIYDVLLAEALHAVFGGHLGVDPRTGGSLRHASGKESKRYSLEIVTDLVLGRRDAKARDVWRRSYALLEGIPAVRWPEEARIYPLDDVRNPLEIALAQLLGPPGDHEWVSIPPIPGGSAVPDQCRHCGEVLNFSSSTPFCSRAPRRPPHRNLDNLAFQAEAAFALYLGACWGLRTDRERVEILAAEVEEKHRRAVERFQKKGWVRSDGSEDQVALRRAVAEAYDARGSCPRCRGAGKIRPIKNKPCRGAKIRGRYPGCAGAACVTCGGEGAIYYFGDEVTCRGLDQEYRCPDCGDVQFPHPTGGVSCPLGHRHVTPNLVSGCDGTGLDLSTASTLPRTDKGGIKTDRDTLMESGDDDLSDYGENEYEKSRTTYVPYLRTGTNQPLRYDSNALVATGRCSYEESSEHQMPRAGGYWKEGAYIPSERECHRARGAWCGSPVEYMYGSTDYEAGELCTLSQYTYWIFGYSKMRDVINASGRPGILHSDLAAEVLGIPLQELLRRLEAKDRQAADFRQMCKPINFGVPGGMGAAKQVLTSRKKNAGFTVCERGPARNEKGEPGYWGVRFCVLTGGHLTCGEKKVLTWKGRPCAPVCAACLEIVEHALRAAYFKRYPEILDYFRWVSSRIERGEPAPCLVWDREAQRPRVVRWRGGCDFSAYCNNGFQSMLSDAGKLAVIRMTREMYLGERWDRSGPSPLGGCRMPIYLHDEPLTEPIAETAHQSGPRVAEIMVEAGRGVAPDVVWRAETALAYYWSKSMAPVYDADGRLVPWEPTTPEERRAVA